jgi:hypothetical protein
MRLRKHTKYLFEKEALGLVGQDAPVHNRPTAGENEEANPLHSPAW